MKKIEFTFHNLHAVIWKPDDQPVEKVLQIAHGMTEHIGRYERFAEFFTAQNIAVAGFDLRGHGKNEGDQTCASFGKGGWQSAVEDVHGFYEVLRQEFPGAKHYMLGFSLGSFLLREYLSTYPEDKVEGAVIMGTGQQPAVVLSLIIKVIQGEIKKVGYDRTTPLVQNLSFGTYNKKFQPNRTASDWLCADEKELDAYITDAYCRKDISAGLFADLLSAMKRTGNKKTYQNWRKDMPILLISGTNDPVGDMTKGVKAVHKQMLSVGFKDVQLELLDGARHDVLHEYQCGAAERAMELIKNWM